MFLDEELELIHNDSSVEDKDKSVALLEACTKRLPDAIKVSPTDFLNEVKKVESGWRLFCKNHPKYKPDGLRKCLEKLWGDALTQPIKSYLGWNHRNRMD